jgi:AraC family transcriptional activator of mtrCDE
MNPERSVDPLSSVASLLRVKPQLQQLCRFGAQWASEHAAEKSRWAPFHLVTLGGCILGRNYSGFSGRRTACGQFETFVALI